MTVNYTVSNKCYYGRKMLHQLWPDPPCCSNRSPSSPNNSGGGGGGAAAFYQYRAAFAAAAFQQHLHHHNVDTATSNHDPSAPPAVSASQHQQPQNPFGAGEHINPELTAASNAKMDKTPVQSAPPPPLPPPLHPAPHASSPFYHHRHQVRAGHELMSSPLEQGNCYCEIFH